MIFIPKQFKLYSAVVDLNGNIIKLYKKSKTFKTMFTNDKQDIVEMV